MFRSSSNLRAYCPTGSRVPPAGRAVDPGRLDEHLIGRGQETSRYRHGTSGRGHEMSGGGLRTISRGQGTIRGGQRTIRRGQRTIRRGQWTIRRGQRTIRRGPRTIIYGQGYGRSLFLEPQPAALFQEMRFTPPSGTDRTAGLSKRTLRTGPTRPSGLRACLAKERTA